MFVPDYGLAGGAYSIITGDYKNDAALGNQRPGRWPYELTAIAPTKNPVYGFQDRFTQGGQGRDVMQHVAASAGLNLVGKGDLVHLQNFDDALQGIGRLFSSNSHVAESLAEINGNVAGGYVATEITKFNASGDSAALRDQLRKMLCK